MGYSSTAWTNGFGISRWSLVVARSSITMFWCDLGSTKWANPTALFHMWKTWPYFTVLLLKYRSTSMARVSMTKIALSSSSASFWPPKTGSSIKFKCGCTSWLVVGLTAKKQLTASEIVGDDCRCLTLESPNSGQACL